MIGKTGKTSTTKWLEVSLKLKQYEVQLRQVTSRAITAETRVKLLQNEIQQLRQGKATASIGENKDLRRPPLAPVIPAAPKPPLSQQRQQQLTLRALQGQRALQQAQQQQQTFQLQQQALLRAQLRSQLKQELKNEIQAELWGKLQKPRAGTPPVFDAGRGLNVAADEFRQGNPSPLTTPKARTIAFNRSTEISPLLSTWLPSDNNIDGEATKTPQKSKTSPALRPEPGLTPLLNVPSSRGNSQQSIWNSRKTGWHPTDWEVKDPANRSSHC